jgi:GAF domain-containing protein
VGATEELRARNRQRSALAVVSQNAINAEDLTALLNEAAAVAAETLAAEHSAILQILPDGDELVLRAGVGWNAGPAGPHRVPATVGSAYGFVLHADAPIVVSDMRQETRFDSPPAWLEHGVIATMHVIIRGRRRPWGILGVHSTRPRVFSEDDVDFLQSVANVLALTLERDEVKLAQPRENETLQAIFDLRARVLENH